MLLRVGGQLLLASGPHIFNGALYTAPFQKAACSPCSLCCLARLSCLLF